jgi:two-component system OmpR family response regulator
MPAAKQNILVVEDEQHLAVGIKYNLQAEGYTVQVVDDGPAAVKFVEDHTDALDLVILDIMLPGMSGYSVCERIREMGNDMPILILSARTLTEDRTHGFDVGADQYLTKPFDLDELLSRVKALLALFQRRAMGAVRRNRFRFGVNEVDFDTYEVKIKGEDVKLTELEMKLLRFLIENEGRVIRRHELLEKVWEMPGSITTRAVDQFIRRLRKLFEPDPSQPRFFMTIRDAGYRFTTDSDNGDVG